MARIKEPSFGRVIRERRRQLGLTQEKVARRSKISTPYVGLLESGKRHPSDKIVTRLAGVLGLDRRELFFLANPRTQAIVSPRHNGDTGAEYAAKMPEPETETKSAWEEFRQRWAPFFVAAQPPQKHDMHSDSTTPSPRRHPARLKANRARRRAIPMALDTTANGVTRTVAKVASRSLTGGR